MIWYSEPATSRLSVTAHAVGESTRVRVDSAPEILALVALPVVGVLAMARAFWTSSTRAIRERVGVLLDAVGRSLSNDDTASTES